MNNIRNKTWKGFLKKGLVFCMIGVMALGLVACGGKDKKSNTKAPKTQTEQSTDKKDDTDIEKPQDTTGADQDTTDDTKAQDGADKKSDTKKSTSKNSTKKNSTAQKSNQSGSTTKDKKNN